MSQNQARVEDSAAANFDELAAIVEALRKKVNKLEDENFEIREDLYKKEKQIETLESAVEELQTRNSLIEKASAGSVTKAKDRQAILVQKLYTRAKNSNGRASIDAKQAHEQIFNEEWSRQLMYEDFNKAVKNVGDPNVLYVKKESRASNRNTRLILDLTNGTLPPTLHGEKIKGGNDDLQ